MFRQFLAQVLSFSQICNVGQEVDFVTEFVILGQNHHFYEVSISSKNDSVRILNFVGKICHISTFRSGNQHETK